MNYELILSVLMLFVVLSCATKLSLWTWRQRFAFSTVLAAFVWWSERYAVLQSKTQLADLLQNTESLQNIAILITIETAVNGVFCLCYPRHTVLKYYPSLLIFPVMFYFLTQALFMAVGVDFTFTTVAVAVGTFLVLPLLTEGMKWLVRDAGGRVEILLLLSCLVCILGLASTVTNKMIYRANEAPTDWRMVGLAVVIFCILFLVGYLGSKLKWRFKRNNLNMK